MNIKDIRERIKEQSKLEQKFGMRDLAENKQTPLDDSYFFQSLAELSTRSIQRAQGLSPIIPETKLPIDSAISVKNKSLDSVHSEIIREVQNRGFDPDKVYIRFFGSAREDLVRIHGTDRYGLSVQDTRSKNYDKIVGDYQNKLKRIGLAPEDGLFYTDLESAKNGHEPYLKEFLNGRSSIAIYDDNQINPISDYDLDFGYFKYPPQKLKALLGIISPVT